MFTWIRLQSEVGRWVTKNFPDSPPKHQIWGLIEELGELTHAHLKKEQGIRGSEEKHVAAGKDAIADSVIFFMSACTMHGWAAQDVLHSSSPEEFQMTFTVPEGRSPITHTIKHLAKLVEFLEDSEQTAVEVEKSTHMIGAKGAALSYLSGLAAHCTQMGWSLQEIIEEVWPKVRQRDWTKNKVTGGDIDAPTYAGVDMAVANLEGVTKTEIVTVPKVEHEEPPPDGT